MTFPIFYTNSDILIPSNSAGCMRVFLIPLIFIRKKYRAAGVDVVIANNEFYTDDSGAFITLG